MNHAKGVKDRDFNLSNLALLGPWIAGSNAERSVFFAISQD
jgi:hypothetical protein